MAVLEDVFENGCSGGGVRREVFGGGVPRRFSEEVFGGSVQKNVFKRRCSRMCVWEEVFEIGCSRGRVRNGCSEEVFKRRYSRGGVREWVFGRRWSDKVFERK